MSAQPEPEYQLTHAASTLMGPALEPLGGSGSRRESRVGGQEGLSPWLAGEEGVGGLPQGPGQRPPVGSPGLSIPMGVSCQAAWQGGGQSFKPSPGLSGAPGPLQGGFSLQHTAGSTLI